MQDLKIATIQSDLYWENIAKNIAQFEDKIDLINSEIDVIILPEMFTTGFSMKSKILAEKMDGKTVDWMQKMAIKKQVCILGSIIIEENKKYYNRLICVFKNGEILHYDKRHLFTFGDEHNHFSAGENRLVFELKGWKICPLICYDLRFPVWSRNTEDIDLYIYTANWPEVRIPVWDTLLRARSIENVSYVIGVNRIGVDGTDKKYSGNSVVLDFKGDSILDFPKNENFTGIVSLTKSNLMKFREKFPALKDGDKFQI